MNKNDILAIVLPTCEPETLREFWLPSIENIEELAPISTICINFQSPYTWDEINEIVNEIRSHGFEIVYTFNEYDTSIAVPFNKIRNDAVCFNPDFMFYAITDDDFMYQGSDSTTDKTAGRQYLDAIHYLLTHEKCGCVSIKGACKSNLLSNKFYMLNPLEMVFSVDKGLIFRNMQKHGFNLFPNSSCDLLGGGEENILVASRLAEGYYPVLLQFGRTKHYENCKITGEEQYNWNNPRILEENANSFLREHYNANLDSRIPVICDPQIYLDHDGLEYNEENFAKLSEDYTGSNSSISKILELAGIEDV